MRYRSKNARRSVADRVVAGNTNVFATCELFPHILVEYNGLQLGRNDLAQGALVTRQVVPRHAVIQVMLKMEADVQRHQEPAKRKERRSRSEQTILVEAYCAAVFESQLYVLSRRQDLHSQKHRDRYGPTDRECRHDGD